MAREAWSRGLTDRTRLVLVAHLLGTRSELDDLFELCAYRRIPVVEDCAQAFDGLDYLGDSRALASLFSFGAIKTGSALGGGMGIIRDADLRDAIRERVGAYPQQSRWRYLGKVAQYGVMKALTRPMLYGLFVRACRWTGRSHDQVINGAVLGLKGDDYLAVLRMRPSVPLMALLRRRLRHPDGASLDARRGAGDQLLELLSKDVPVLGRHASHHSWWQFCVVSPDPATLISHLRMRGFDATDGSSENRPSLREGPFLGSLLAET